jgi:hypothetical protein
MTEETQINPYGRLSGNCGVEIGIGIGISLDT